MSITAHYVTASWELKEKCLETTYLPDDHTANVLAANLQESTDSWAWRVPKEKLSCVTTDNGANIINSFRDLEWPWLNCFGHNLTVAVNSAGKKEEKTMPLVYVEKSMWPLCTVG